jgi:midasin (ATPase involved in ribosome maturation)
VTFQILSLLLELPLHIVNCHQTTETSDLIGGLRPVRGRSTLLSKVISTAKYLLEIWPEKKTLYGMQIPDFLKAQSSDGSSVDSSLDFSDDAMSATIEFVKILRASAPITNDLDDRVSKRPKLDDSISPNEFQETWIDAFMVLKELDDLFHQHTALFEWVDGPLVNCMKRGELILLDEISLTDDAVLERLNSVLEPSRAIVLAEKGMVDGDDSVCVQAMDSFQLFATMNPGGDFGKRELSPALRSRFTEIWVPPVSDLSDIEIVLERMLYMDPSSIVVKSRMIEYFDWFNREVCCDPTVLFSGLVLSLRDVLTWARFVVEARAANNAVNVWEAYRHGARLMHLDGLGLGSGMSSVDAFSVRLRAEEFLRKQMSEEGCADECTQSFDFSVSANLFGVDPFYISLGSQPIHSQVFNFGAPTTSLNVLRVLRALQISKPILLEGPPGVGKTTLIAAIAEASGHKLVRINLSEQTDISDLIGSDLPVPHSSEEGSISTSFCWFDGVLLSAIRNGDWVLLDELNLASQSVLEGLNSCLDHRASVFIPELGKSVNCPTSFRVFAAQNPMGQGGGRKGLPKSFLNRFTKVFVDNLSCSDLQVIVNSRFPHQVFADNFIEFNTKVCSALAESAFGRDGTPWEFNLRDIFRWCELFEARKGESDIANHEKPSNCSPLRFVRDLYFQRFRNKEDREYCRKLYDDVFRTEHDRIDQPAFLVTDAVVQIGDVSILRNPYHASLKYDTDDFDLIPRLDLLVPIEAVARCVSMNWPCLLVGKSLSGKSLVVHSLAHLTNSSVIEITLSSASDVSELIGCFEQVDWVDGFLIEAQKLIMLADDFLVHRSSSPCAYSVGMLLNEFRQILKSTRSQFDDCILIALKLSNILSASMHQNYTLRTKIMKLVYTFESMRNKRKVQQNSTNFAWKDGGLVRAMEEGSWLHLRNANLCSSSVLDRLNPVLEPNGCLILSESGVIDVSTTSRHREVRCHPNFRVFLSINPDHGEVSRAMRNRCVEVSLLERSSWTPCMELFDDLDDASLSCLHSVPLVRSLSAIAFGRRHTTRFGDDEEGFFHTTNICSLFVTVLYRGMQSTAIFASLLGQVYNSQVTCSEFVEKEVSTILSAQIIAPRPFGRRSNKKAAFFPQSTMTQWWARLLAMYSGSLSIDAHFPLFLGNGEGEEFGKLRRFIRINESSLELRDRLIFLFLKTLDVRFLSRAVVAFENLSGTLKASVQFLANICFASRNIAVKLNEEAFWILSRRVSQVLKEHLLIEQLSVVDSQKSVNEMTVLEVSFFLSRGIFDRSVVDCPLTPLFFPFFFSFDAWANEALKVSSAIVDVEGFLVSFHPLLSLRDCLWNHLSECPYLSRKIGRFGFVPNEFVVQWSLLKVQLSTCQVFFDNVISFSKIKERLDFIIDSIEKGIFDRSNEDVLLGSSLMRAAVCPIVPRSADAWLVLSKAKSLCRSLIVDRRSMLSSRPSQTMFVSDFCTEFPVVFAVDQSFKSDLLGLLCTIQFADILVARYHSNLSILGTINEVPFVLERNLSRATALFSAKLTSVRLDQESILDRNTYSVSDLDSVVTQSESIQNDFISSADHVLKTFSNIQIASCYESWCERYEESILKILCGILIEETENSIQQRILPHTLAFKKFVDIAISFSFWDVSDLLPYQALIWLCESEHLENTDWKRYANGFISTMLCNASKRTWLRSSDLFQVVSFSLEYPLFEDSDKQVRKDRKRGSDSLTQQLTRRHCLVPMIFCMIGDCFEIEPPTYQGIAVLTLENFPYRLVQSGRVIELLSLFDSPTETLPNDVAYLFREVLLGLNDVLPHSVLAALSTFISNQSGEHRGIYESLRAFSRVSSNQGVRSCIDKILLPLLHCLEDLDVHDRLSLSSGTESSALAKIYLGLLRFHLLLPNSPVDPGQTVIAEISSIDRRLSNLGMELASLQLNSHAIRGDFNPLCESTPNILIEGNALLARRTGLKADIIERPLSSPAFFELYDESLEFSRTHFSFDTVLSLKDIVCNMKGNDKSFCSGKQHANHWQLTTEEFCVSMLRKFELYEDIVTPLISSVGIVKQGVDLLVRVKTAPEKVNAFALFTCFPQVEVCGVCEKLTYLFHSIEVTSSDLRDFKYSLALSVLSRFLLERKVIGMDRNLLKSWFSVVDTIVDGIVETQNEYKHDLCDEDERLFREQFPDFSNSFVHEEHSDNEGSTAIEADLVAPSDLSRSFKHFLCVLHQMFFSDCLTPIEDPYRTHMFQLCYNAARKGHELFGNDINVYEYAPVTSSGHVMALSLVSPNSSQTKIRNMIVDSAQDFYNDPNPSESKRAAPPVKRIMAKTVQLLTLFPDNTVLLEILRISDRVVKLNLQSTALGRVLTGLELILKHSQDWEQHASARVRLGEPLVAVARLVASWRKLELKSWPELLSSREIRISSRGREHWTRIHSILRRFVVASMDEPVFTHIFLGTPRWAWKSISRNSDRLTVFLQGPREEFISIVKALDTFCLTSPVGEFHSRLNILRSFVYQTRAESLVRQSPFGLLQLYFVLKSLWHYYDQFDSLVSRLLISQRHAYETRLGQEVKLAKWDDQTYYAMSESTERNHRKLMQILRDYDKVLEASSVECIEMELNRGVQLDLNSTADATNVIPTHSLLFGIEADMSISFPANEYTQLVSDKTSARAWTDASLLGIEKGYRLERLSKKMMTFLDKPIGVVSNRGFHTVSELCETIFERIGFLRLEHSTQAMKERALTDLLKELRRHGFSSTKWSVPVEVRQMGELFLLPCPAFDNPELKSIDSSIMARSERYYQRFLAEIYRFRNEVAIFGSEFMTSRQLESMLGFCDHGLYLTAQQRCIASCVLSQRKSLSSLIDSIASFSVETLLGNQATCKQQFLKVKNYFAQCVESIRQLLLLLKSSQHLFSSSTIKHEWFQVTTEKFDSFLSSINLTLLTGEIVFVSVAQVREIEQLRDTLATAASLLSSCKIESTLKECLPSQAFSACENLIAKAEESAIGFLQISQDIEGIEEDNEVPNFVRASAQAIDSVLVFAQTCVRDADNSTSSENNHDDAPFESIWDMHRSTAEYWKSLNVQKLLMSVNALLEEVTSVHGNNCIDKSVRNCCSRYTTDIGVLYDIALSLHDKILLEYLKFYGETTKLLYIILRIFRVLRAKGFCSSKAKSAENGESGDGTTNGLTFEDDKEGTGMGEGDGKTDVTDQLENEEQLLGLKGDSKNPCPLNEQPETKQLDKEEAAKGMEMEGDFDGEMYDMPDDAGDEPTDDKHDDEEEVDREMGLDGSPNEEVIDEKLWDESDDEANAGGLEEKFEQNSSVKGDGAGDEMITKEDAEGKDHSSPEKSNESSSEQQEKVDESNALESEKINEDTDDLYEESNGVKVRDESRQDEGNEIDEGDLGEDLSIEEDAECINDQELDNAMADIEEENGNCAVPPTLDSSNVDSDCESNPVEEEPDVNTTSENIQPSDVNGEAEDESQDNEGGSPPNADIPMNNSVQRGLGVRDKDGGDIVLDADNSIPEKPELSETKLDAADVGTDMGSMGNESSSAEHVSGCQNGENVNDNSSGMSDQQTRNDAPNPLKSPGDASKFWHRKLNMMKSSRVSDSPSETLEINTDENNEDKGAFEFANENQGSTSQGLGEADENDVLHLDELKEVLDDDSSSDEKHVRPFQDSEKASELKEKSSSQSKVNQNKSGQLSELDFEKEEFAEADTSEDGNREEMIDAEFVAADNGDESQNQVVSDMSQLYAKEESFDQTPLHSFIDETHQTTLYSPEEASLALTRWSVIQNETHNLSRRLCEKLRLVMEPLVASKLKGDYRTGKRINMKRVIGYVASGYRKDKIWLRRTKPAKRNYRVLLAVDDSESMLKSGAGDMALKAMATLAVGMSQLEVGEIGIASFGNEMELVHPFHLPFTLDSGVNVVRSFQFNQKRTRTALCIESALLALEHTAGDYGAMQLVFMISDGRIERDSRSTIRRLIREMVEQNVLLVLIIVEGSEKMKDSIMNMKEVNFKNGKPIVKHFIEDYPFPYYIILNDMQALPEVLGDALRQWFEMIARVQTTSS